MFYLMKTNNVKTYLSLFFLKKIQLRIFWLFYSGFRGCGEEWRVFFGPVESRNSSNLVELLTYKHPIADDLLQMGAYAIFVNSA